MKNNVLFFNVFLIALVISLSSFLNNDTVINSASEFGGWSKLGKQKVSEGVTFDELVLTEEKTNVKRLKVKVLKASVFIINVKVLYKDGTSENHTVSRRLKKGDVTRSFDLIGHHRIVQKIVFVYRGNSNKGGAELVVMAKL